VEERSLEEQEQEQEQASEGGRWNTPARGGNAKSLALANEPSCWKAAVKGVFWDPTSRIPYVRKTHARLVARARTPPTYAQASITSAG